MRTSIISSSGFILSKTELHMVKLSTKVCFDITLERKRKPSEETTKTISKVLRVAKETIRLRIRKKT
jgi:hypothetical protein